MELPLFKSYGWMQRKSRNKITMSQTAEENKQELLSDFM